MNVIEQLEQERGIGGREDPLPIDDGHGQQNGVRLGRRLRHPGRDGGCQ